MKLTKTRSDDDKKTLLLIEIPDSELVSNKGSFKVFKQVTKDAVRLSTCLHALAELSAYTEEWGEDEERPSLLRRIWNRLMILYLKWKALKW